MAKSDENKQMYFFKTQKEKRAKKKIKIKKKKRKGRITKINRINERIKT